MQVFAKTLHKMIKKWSKMTKLWSNWSFLISESQLSKVYRKLHVVSLFVLYLSEKALLRVVFLISKKIDLYAIKNWSKINFSSKNFDFKSKFFGKIPLPEPSLGAKSLLFHKNKKRAKTLLRKAPKSRHFQKTIFWIDFWKTSSSVGNWK